MASPVCAGQVRWLGPQATWTEDSTRLGEGEHRVEVAARWPTAHSIDVLTVAGLAGVAAAAAAAGFIGEAAAPGGAERASERHKATRICQLNVTWMPYLRGARGASGGVRRQ